MTIKILPPQLANQIAAGEVVERPSSVVKELVENALDAGADKIEIEIDKGGHKRILIRDNGKGIDKEQLSLALSRHATSKISDLDDLEAIVSLGFRGEALASISSVSRLTMTSKPADQAQAWSAIAEGLDMDVMVKPAAHPNGTSVEVLDLFFNTPARRKFLRAEKTEFSHIETLIKRIALSRSDASFTLKHNGRFVKRYRSQSSELNKTSQVSNRIAEVINPAFVQDSNHNSVVYDEVDMSVWVKNPMLCSFVNPAQYCFVNGRMMRDKLLQHAIRQAFADTLEPQQQPEYVLFIDLPAKDVDVNVHPAKHEVRFHYARLLHDLVVKTIEETLLGFTAPADSLPLVATDDLASDNDTGPIDQKPDWIVSPQQIYVQQPVAKQEVRSNSGFTISETPPPQFSHLKPTEVISDKAEHTKPTIISNYENNQLKSQGLSEKYHQQDSDRASVQLLYLAQYRYAYVLIEQQVMLVDLNTLISRSEEIANDFSHSENWRSSPLLVPVRIKMNSAEKQTATNQLSLLEKLGFELKIHQQFLIVKKVPTILRNSETAVRIPALFDRLFKFTEVTKSNVEQVVLNVGKQVFTEGEARQLINEFQSEPDKFSQLKSIAYPLDPAKLLD